MSHENADFKAAVSNVGPTVSENRTAVHRGARANDGTAAAARGAAAAVATAVPTP